jgi:release factor glutamine methyltransferase
VSPQKWIIKDLLEVTSDYLKKKDIDSPRLCAEILLAHQLKTTRIKLYLNFDQPLNEKDINEYRGLIQRRLKREPVQYITGVQEFWSLEFNVGPRVLIPRPETEILVEQAISILKNKQSVPEPARFSVLDIGTGSGVIAVSIAHELQDVDIRASDISVEALETAKANACKHGLDSRIQFMQSDLFSALSNESHLFDVIVTNPPYVAAEEYDDLPPEVGQFEPRSALDGGDAGLFYINRIIQEAKDYLKPDGWLLIEMAPFQTAKAMEMVDQSCFYGEKKVVKDYSKKDRVVRVQKLINTDLNQNAQKLQQ